MASQKLRVKKKTASKSPTNNGKAKLRGKRAALTPGGTGRNSTERSADAVADNPFDAAPDLMPFRTAAEATSEIGVTVEPFNVDAMSETLVATPIRLDHEDAAADTSHPIANGANEKDESFFNYTFTTIDQHLAALTADPLGQLERDLIDCGLAPVLPTATLVYLVKASPYAGRPVSLQIRGDSESFKSMTAAKVARLHSERDIIQCQSVTRAALMEGFGRGGDLRRTTIVLDENIESRKRDPDLMATMRELTTKERVTRSKMQRGVPVEITLLGPAAVIDCMLTDTLLTAQDVNRFIVIGMPEGSDVRQAICLLNAERFDDRGAKRRRLTDVIADGHRAFMGQLNKELVVNKPELVTGTNISPRFDSAVFGLVCTTAWLRQGNRTSPGRTVTATIDDYEYVWSLLRSVNVLFPTSALSGSAARLLDSWQKLAKREGNLPITTSQLHNGIASQMDLGAFGRIANELLRAGYKQPNAKSSTVWRQAALLNS